MSDTDTEESRPPGRRARKPRKSAPRKPSKEAAAAPAVKAAAEVAGDASPAPVSLIRMPLAVRWRDLDAFNHVNNSKYLSYLEEARLHWMTGLPGQGLEGDVAPVVAAATLNYRRPIAWPAQLVVELFVERLGNTSVTIGHRVLDAADASILYCDGHTVLVWIGRDTGRAAPLPEGVRESCTGSSA